MGRIHAQSAHPLRAGAGEKRRRISATSHPSNSICRSTQSQPAVIEYEFSPNDQKFIGQVPGELMPRRRNRESLPYESISSNWWEKNFTARHGFPEAAQSRLRLGQGEAGRLGESAERRCALRRPGSDRPEGKRRRPPRSRTDSRPKTRSRLTNNTRFRLRGGEDSRAESKRKTRRQLSDHARLQIAAGAGRRMVRPRLLLDADFSLGRSDAPWHDKRSSNAYRSAAPARTIPWAFFGWN